MLLRKVFKDMVVVAGKCLFELYEFRSFFWGDTCFVSVAFEREHVAFCKIAIIRKPVFHAEPVCVFFDCCVCVCADRAGG